MRTIFAIHIPTTTATSTATATAIASSDIEENIRDPFTEVGVTAKCLLRLQLLSGGWVRIFPAARTPLSSTAAAATAAAARTLTPLSVDSTTTNDNNNSPYRRLQESHSSAYSSTRQHNSIFAEGLLCRAVAVSSGLTTSLASDLPTTVGGDSELEQPPPLASDEVFLPPSVAFNAGLGPFSEYVVVKRAENGGGGGGGGGALGLLGGGAAVLHRSPPIARTASVSRVKRPRSAAAAGGGSGAGGGGAWSGPVSTAKRARAHALALTSFFSTPRVLRFGDVFGVSIPRPGGGRSTGGGGGDGGGSGDEGGVGCWWQELPEDDSADSEANEDEAIDTASGFATTAATPTATTAATISTPAVAAEPWFGWGVREGRATSGPRSELAPTSSTPSTSSTSALASVSAGASTGPREHPAVAAPCRKLNGGEVHETGEVRGTQESRGARGTRGASGANEVEGVPRRRRSDTARERFREAIVRQGSDLVFFRVTGLEGEGGGGNSDGGDSGGGGGRGGGDGGSDSIPGGGETRRNKESFEESRRGAGYGCSRRELGRERGGMVVSHRTTELREGGPVCSAIPGSEWYRGFVCRARGYPCPPTRPPLVSLIGFIYVGWRCRCRKKDVMGRSFRAVHGGNDTARQDGVELGEGGACRSAVVLSGK